MNRKTRKTLLRRCLITAATATLLTGAYLFSPSLTLVADDQAPAENSAPGRAPAENHGAGEDHPEPMSITSASGNLYFETAWHPENGLRLQCVRNGNDASKPASLELNLTGGRPTLWSRSSRATDPPVPVANVRWRTNALPETAHDPVEWLLKIRPDEWLLYGNDAWVAWFPAPFAAPMEIQVRTADTGKPVIPQNAFFQRVEPWRFSDDFMIPETDDDVPDLGEWMPVSGRWHIHSVADHAGDIQRGRRTLDPEFSPNFYSMKGMGTNAVITAGYDFYDRYRFSAAVELQPGEMGLVFYFSEMTQEYYAFTLTLPATGARNSQLALWHTVDGDPDQRRFLAAARIPDLFPEQWARLEIETRHDRIIARMDERTVFDIDHHLPGGGAFGFFADADIDIIFDDVTAKSVPDLDLRDRERIQFHTLAVHGDFFPEPQISWWRRWLRRPAAATPPGRLEPVVSAEDQWLVLGAPEHQGQVVSATFHSDAKSFHAGWVTGFSPYDHPSQSAVPHQRFTAQRSGKTMTFRLFEVDATGKMSLVEQFRRPARRPYRDPLTLKLDMSEDRFLRFYCDGELVLIYETDTPPAGGIGPFVGAGTSVSIDHLEYRFSRDDIWTSSQEKNPIYLEDPFMRHWSSPEGEWYTDDDGFTWHKSDFFGRYELTLPVVSNAVVHLGVREGHTNGTKVVTLRNHVATLSRNTGDPSGSQRLLSTEMTRSNRNASTNQALFTLRYEGHWLLMTTGDRTVWRHALRQPLEGTRIRIEGYTIDDLTRSDVVRHNVKDHLFTEAPAEWRLNGGAWRVVNRFQCDPRWSHMNAESADNLAAAWTKDTFEGDFSIEMYAGMRHGWYTRSGDMNITAMSRDGSPSQGYTVTCTGWDPDHSQLDTVLYRNGTEIERTDAYLAPRHRAGNRRLRHEEVVRAGRDVHGAWYYIKLRRIGNRLEYYFDNERVLTWTDDDPIDLGRIGIWTFKNSIMIARVSISARNHRQTPLPIEILPAGGAQRLAVRDTAPDGDDGHQPTAVEATLLETWPTPPPMQADIWRADDPVGQARMAWHHDAAAGPYFTMTTRLGGGPMFARGTLPPQPYAGLAGWRFYLKRTHRANLNVYFSMGTRNDAGEYESAQQYFHRISGTGFDRGNWRKTGATEVPGMADAHTPQWHMKGDWRQVTVWIPNAQRPGNIDPDNLWVRFEGFGIQQPSFEMQGLFGNGPGEAYAVARFAPVLWQPDIPSLADPDATPVPETDDALATEPSYRLYRGTPRSRRVAHGDPEAIFDALRQHAEHGLNTFRLESDTYQPGYPRDLNWLTPTPELDIDARWCSDQPDTLIVGTSQPWPDRRLANAGFQINGVAVNPLETSDNRYRIAVPPHLAQATNRHHAATLDLTVTSDAGQENTLHMDAADPRRVTLGPVLIHLEGMTPVFENFETLEFGSVLQVDADRMRIERDQAARGAFVEISNRARGQRLQTQLAPSLCLARYPLLQFDYRGDRMSFLSLRVHRNWIAKLNEPHSDAVEVQYASPFANDGQWHTWVGKISDVVTESLFDPKMYTINQLRLGSFHRIDQTGNFSRWGLARLVAGPAVATAEQLAFTPRFAGLLPVESVVMAVRPGLDPIRDLSDDQLEGLSWKRIENDARAQPEIDALPDGPAQLILRAGDAHGTWSAPVSIPFLLDRKAPQVTHQMAEDRNPLCNGVRLRLDFDTHHASPIVFEDMRLTFNDQSPVTIGDFGNEVAVRAPGLRVELNWPHLFRKAIQQHSPGEPAGLRIRGLRDGAGNPIEPVGMTLDIPDPDDTTGPAWLPASYPETVRFNTAWKGRVNQRNFFNAAENNSLSIVHNWNEAPFLRTHTHRNTGTITLPFARPGWSLEEHPYLAFRVRQPQMRGNNRARVELEIKFDNNQALRVSLTQPEDSDTTRALPEPIAWRANRWYSVILDVPKLTAQAGIDLDGRSVRSIAFERHESNNRKALDLKDLFVLGTGSPDDTITLDAYDRSGIDGMEWEFVDGNDETISDHGDPRNPASGTQGWFVIRIRDRANNLSVPLRIPTILPDDMPEGTFTEFVNQRIHLKPLEW